jgi:ubiquinone/menaquinone biosynthesis C-methylase UbiE
MIAAERWTAFQEALSRSSLPKEPHVLDVGCGAGADLVRISSFLPTARVLAGVDILFDRLRVAKRQAARGVFMQSSGDALPFKEAAFELVIVSTVFSSVLNEELSSAIAAEIWRVLAPGGMVVYYDVRMPNPTNESTRALRARHIRGLFPEARIRTRAITLVPPLARRIGGMPAVYGFLARFRILRSHHLAVIQKCVPATPRGVGSPSPLGVAT